MQQQTFTVPTQAAGQRLDAWLAGQEETLTRSAIQNLLDAGAITVNGVAQLKKYKLHAGDVLEVEIPDPTPIEAIPQDIPLDIVYEDQYLLVINKPKGMVVHPAVGNLDGTMVNALLYHCKGQLSGINGKIRPGIVHRIDKDTSGLLVVAKCDEAHNGLAQQLKAHTFTRQYEAIVHGKVKDDSGTIKASLGRDSKDRKKMCVTIKNAKEAITHYKVLARYDKYTHLSLQLETGRTHQIRVHMTYKGHPLVGDTVYTRGKTLTGLGGQCLHAKKIGFVHPITAEYLEFTSDLPLYFTQFLDKLR